MMTKFFIWFHRRRAAYHDAMKHHPSSHEWDYHTAWWDWHLAQFARHSKSENPFLNQK